MYRIGVIAGLLAALPAQVHAALTPQACVGGFVALNFSTQNYARYDDYFHSHSVMQLAQAGVYQGPEAIEEYVKFANPDNPAITSRATVNHTFNLMGIDGDHCEFFSMGHSFYVLSSLFSNGKLNVANAFRIFYNATTNKLDRINVFYETEYLRWFSGMVAFPAHQAFVCTNFENTCPSVWSFNNLVSQEDCRTRLAALPTATGEHVSFDGNSQSCRGLHGMLAGLNPTLHCPHISFAPKEDPYGHVRCQTSANIPATDLFTAAQFAMFDNFKVGEKLPTSGYNASVPCSESNPICPNAETCVGGICGMHNATTTTTTTTTTSTTTTTVFVPGNTDCVTNRAEWTLVMTDVNDLLPNFDGIVQCAVAQILDTECDCVDVEGPITRRLFADRGRRLQTVGRKGQGGVFPNATDDILRWACANQTSDISTLICSQAGNGNNCSARAVCGQFTTTTEMPWGMPWWGWFLVCFGICCICTVLCLPLLGAPLAGGKKKPKTPPSTEVVYEVVDVPDEAPMMAGTMY